MLILKIIFNNIYNFNIFLIKNILKNNVFFEFMKIKCCFLFYNFKDMDM